MKIFTKSINFKMMPNNCNLNSLTKEDFLYLSKIGFLKIYQQILKQQDDLKSESWVENIKNENELRKKLNIQLKSLIGLLRNTLEKIQIETDKEWDSYILNQNGDTRKEINQEYLIYYNDEDLEENHKTITNNVNILKKFNSVISEIYYDINYLYYENILNETELINDLIRFDLIDIRMNKRDKEHQKMGYFLPQKSPESYSIVSNFSVFSNIMDKESKEKIKYMHNIFHKKDKLLSKHIKKLEEKCLELKNKYVDKTFKTNVKNIFLLNKKLSNIGIHLFKDIYLQRYLMTFDFKRVILNSNLLELIIKLHKLRYKNLIIVAKVPNLDYLNNEYKIEIEPGIYFNVKIMDLKSLISVTRFKLYGENLEASEEYKLFMENSERLKEINIKNIINKIKHKNINNINDLYKNSLFIFQGLKWSEIALNFRTNGIIISSGMNNKKILVNLLEFKLSQVLLLLFENYPNKFIYDNLVNSSNNLKDDIYKTNFDLNSSNFERTAPFSILDYKKPEIEMYKLMSEEKMEKKTGKLKTVYFVIGLTNKEDINKERKEDKHNLNGNFSLPNTRKYHTFLQNKLIRRYSSAAYKSNFSHIFIEKGLLDRNPFFDYLSKIINASDCSKEKRQLLIENFWNESGVEKAENLKNLTPKINKHLIKCLETLDLKYKDKTLCKKFPDFYEYLNSVHLLMITFCVTMSLITRKQNGWNNAVIKIGGKIFYHIYTQAIINRIKSQKQKFTINNFREMSDIYPYGEFLKDLSVCDNYKYMCAKLGDFFLEILCSEPHVIFNRSLFDPELSFEAEEESLVENDTMYKVIISAKLKDEVLENIMIEPASIPMLCKPKIWTNDTDGGYLIKDYHENNIITGNKAHGHKMQNKEILYKTINTLNQMEFKINNDLLNFLLSEKGKFLIKSVLDRKRITLAEKLQFFTNLRLAEIFSKETFYLPLKADFRGRLYVTSFFLNYQGNEIGKALVYFNKGEILNEEGRKNFYIYGANLYNPSSLNKENHEERLKWVKQNLSNIYQMDIEFLSKADNIWLFTSFCLIMKKLKEKPDLIVCFPIFIDATCSGIQHIAAMIKDTDLGLNVNLTKQHEEDKVADIYNKLLKTINLAISLEGNDINTKHPNLKHVELTRSDVKQPIMTKTYNVSLLGMKNQIMLSLREKERKAEITLIEKDNIKEFIKNKDLEDFNIKIKSYINGKSINLDYLDIFKIAQILEGCIFSNFPRLKLVYDFLKNTCKVLNKLDLPVVWTTPSGLMITQKYNKSFNNKVSINFAGVTKKLVLKEWKQELDKKAQINGIIPNIVHSLDAAHLIGVIQNCEYLNIYPILPIHDCFGCHPNKLNKLFEILKLEFINIYSKEEFLTQYLHFVELYLKNNGFKIIGKNNKKYVIYKTRSKMELPVVPKCGDLNLSEIMDSKHMFN
uniref:DNA-directed RNA polymerase n=2 Tax=unclassified Termitomyces TaxID=2634893 RepID=A0A8F1D5H3_9AGAR|nr:RNA polymerase [Termitomyces sp. T50a]